MYSFADLAPSKEHYSKERCLHKEGENALIIVETEGKSGQAFLVDEPDLG